MNKTNTIKEDVKKKKEMADRRALLSLRKLVAFQ